MSHSGFNIDKEQNQGILTEGEGTVQLTFSLRFVKKKNIVSVLKGADPN